MDFPVGARLPLQLVHPGFRNGHEQCSPHAHHRTLPHSQSSGKQSFILSIKRYTFFSLCFGFRGPKSVTTLMVLNVLQAFFSAIAMMTGATSVFTVVKVFPGAVSVMTLHGTYAFFALVSLLAFAVTSIFVPHAGGDRSSQRKDEMSNCSIQENR